MAVMIRSRRLVHDADTDSALIYSVTSDVDNAWTRKARYFRALTRDSLGPLTRMNNTVNTETDVFASLLQCCLHEQDSKLVFAYWACLQPRHCNLEDYLIQNSSALHSETIRFRPVILLLLSAGVVHNLSSIGDVDAHESPALLLLGVERPSSSWGLRGPPLPGG